MWIVIRASDVVSENYMSLLIRCGARIDVFVVDVVVVVDVVHNLGTSVMAAGQQQVGINNLARCVFEKKLEDTLVWWFLQMSLSWGSFQRPYVVLT